MAEVDRGELRGDSPRNRPGRPPEPGSLRRVADRLGVDKKEISDARQHVAAVEEYPELEDQPQSVAIAAAKAIDSIISECDTMNQLSGDLPESLFMRSF